MTSARTRPKPIVTGMPSSTMTVRRASAARARTIRAFRDRSRRVFCLRAIAIPTRPSPNAVFDAMMTMQKIDVAKIEATRRGETIDA